MTIALKKTMGNLLVAALATGVPTSPVERGQELFRNAASFDELDVISASVASPAPESVSRPDASLRTAVTEVASAFCAEKILQTDELGAPTAQGEAPAWVSTIRVDASKLAGVLVRLGLTDRTPEDSDAPEISALRIASIRKQLRG